MNTKDKLLFVWVVLVLASGFLFSHFWSCTVSVIERVVAFGVVPAVVSKILAEIVGVQFFP